MEKYTEHGKSAQSLSIQKSFRLQDYRKYSYSLKEKAKLLLLSFILSCAIAVLFYDTPVFCVMTIPAYIFFTRVKRTEYSAARKRVLMEQFKDGILSVAASLQAGYSIENSFKEAMNEMEKLHGENSIIYREFNHINWGLSVNITLDELLLDLADRSDCEDIETFCQVFIFAKKSGGNIGHVIKRSAAVITERLDTIKEITTDIASRKYESLIMSLMPVFIIGYVRFSTPGYFDCLYHNITGMLVMTGALAVYAFAFVLSEKLMDIGADY